jgi:hypothetical protein
MAKPLALALEACHNDPGVRARLLPTLDAISALPEVSMLSEPEAAAKHVDLAKVCSPPMPLLMMSFITLTVLGLHHAHPPSAIPEGSRRAC